MNLTLHNFLTCAEASCGHYPLKIVSDAAAVQYDSVDFNESRVRGLLEKLDLVVLREAAASLAIEIIDFEDVSELDMEALRQMHKCLFELEIDNGELHCTSCAARYKISSGIPRMTDTIKEHV